MAITKEEMMKKGRMPNLAWLTTDGAWLVTSEAERPSFADNDERDHEEFTPKFFPGVDRRWLEFVSAYNGAFQICGDKAEVMEGTKEELDAYIAVWLQFQRDKDAEDRLAAEDEQRLKDEAEKAECEAAADLRWARLAERHATAKGKLWSADRAFKKMDADDEPSDCQAAADKLREAEEDYAKLDAARESLLAEARTRLAAGKPLDPEPAREAAAKRKAKEAAKMKAAHERMVARWRAKLGQSGPDADAGETA